MFWHVFCVSEAILGKVLGEPVDCYLSIVLLVWLQSYLPMKASKLPV